MSSELTDFMQGLGADSAPSQPVAIPFRSDLLNLLTGGGVGCGFITEISGNPNLYKSTQAAEVVGAALSMFPNSVVIIHDKERKLIDSRFQTLGIDLNKYKDRFHYFKDRVPAEKVDDLITIERLFDDMAKITRKVREMDLAKVKQRFLEGKATKAEIEYYGKRLGCGDAWKDKEKTAACTYIAGKDGRNFATPNQLRPEDKTLILAVADSTTAIPAREEAFDRKTGLPNTSPQPALQARAWSQQLRNCLFFDERLAMLHLAQIRTAGIMGFHSHPYKKAAVSSAQEFYSTVRLMITASAGTGSVLYREPNSGMILKGEKFNSHSDRIYQVGNIVNVSVKKNIDSLKMDIPLFMLGATGTDSVNSMWEFMHQHNYVKHTSGGWYEFTEDFVGVWPAKFQIKDFYQIYREAGPELWKALCAWKNRIVYGTPSGEATYR